MSLRKDTLFADLRGAAPSDRVRPDLDAIPASPVTRFAPAPTGDLHLGHLVNAIYVWGIARARGGRVILRIEDHDRQRSRSGYERAILDDLARLGLVADEPPVAAFRHGLTSFRQSDSMTEYQTAFARLDGAGLLYACACTRATVAAWAETNGRGWSGPGCPGACRERRLAADGSIGLRVAFDDGSEAWTDLLLGPCDGEAAATGDPLVRDRVGNWTYTFCVVVDDIRHGIDLVIRGRDLVAATAVQIRLARLLGRETPPRFLHHPLLRHRSGQKLSKAAADTSLRSMLDAGWSAAGLLGQAASLTGLQADPAPIEVEALSALFTAGA